MYVLIDTIAHNVIESLFGVETANGKTLGNLTHNLAGFLIPDGLGIKFSLGRVGTPEFIDNSVGICAKKGNKGNEKCIEKLYGCKATLPKMEMLLCRVLFV